MSDATAGKPKCFIAMPITTTPDQADVYGDGDHWVHVMDNLFVPAIVAAGFEAVRPITTGAYMIHQQIISNLESADMVLCDLSGHNPNVFFELGVRTSLDLPIALVTDGKSRLPFDTSGINTHEYDSSISVWVIDAQREALTAHLQSSHASCGGTNPLWRQFGLTLRAQEPTITESPVEAKLDLMGQMVHDLGTRIDSLTSQTDRARWERNVGSPTPNESHHLRFIAAQEFVDQVAGMSGSDKVRYQLVSPDVLQITTFGGRRVSKGDQDYVHDLAQSKGFRLQLVQHDVESSGIDALFDRPPDDSSTDLLGSPPPP